MCCGGRWQFKALARCPRPHKPIEKLERRLLRARRLCLLYANSSKGSNFARLLSSPVTHNATCALWSDFLFGLPIRLLVVSSRRSLLNCQHLTQFSREVSHETPISLAHDGLRHSRQRNYLPHNDARFGAVARETALIHPSFWWFEPAQ